MTDERREMAEVTMLALEAGLYTTPEMQAALADYVFGCSWCDQDDFDQS